MHLNNPKTYQSKSLILICCQMLCRTIYTCIPYVPIHKYTWEVYMQYFYFSTIMLEFGWIDTISWLFHNCFYFWLRFCITGQFFTVETVSKTVQFCTLKNCLQTFFFIKFWISGTLMEIKISKTYTQGHHLVLTISSHSTSKTGCY